MHKNLYREKYQGSVSLVKEVPPQQENTIQLRLTVEQILAAIMLLGTNEREQLWKMLSMVIEDITIEQNIQAVDPSTYSLGKSCNPISEIDSTHILKTQMLNERLENLLDQQIFNTVESDLVQRSLGKRPEGWMTWEEACSELDALDEV